MLQLVRIAALGSGLGGGRQRHFHAHDGIGMRPRRLGSVAEQTEHLLHVLHVAIADLFRFRVVFRVVVTIRQAEAALVDIRNLLLGVVRVLCRAGPEHQFGAGVFQLQARDNLRQIACGLDGGDQVQLWLDRRNPPPVHRRFIHARPVVVADLLVHRVAILRGCRLFEDGPQ